MMSLHKEEVAALKAQLVRAARPRSVHCHHRGRAGGRAATEAGLGRWARRPRASKLTLTLTLAAAKLDNRIKEVRQLGACAAVGGAAGERRRAEEQCEEARSQELRATEAMERSLSTLRAAQVLLSAWRCFGACALH